MHLALQPASPADIDACEALNRSNMARYLASRGIAWDPARFRASWAAFENLVIVDGEARCGFLRLLPEGDALAIRDLQLLPARQGRGIGSWAVAEARRLAAARGFAALRLRVYAENPALALYARLGFVVERVDGTVIHMRCPILRD